MGRTRMDVDLANAICDDLPDGAYWARMSELTDMDPADMFPGPNRSKNSRKTLRAMPHKTTPKPRKQLEAFGALRQCNEHHWQLRGEFGVLNWWPHKGKWNFDGDPAEAGEFKDMLAKVARISAEMKAAKAAPGG